MNLTASRIKCYFPSDNNVELYSVKNNNMVKTSFPAGHWLFWYLGNFDINGTTKDWWVCYIKASTPVYLGIEDIAPYVVSGQESILNDPHIGGIIPGTGLSYWLSNYFGASSNSTIDKVLAVAALSFPYILVILLIIIFFKFNKKRRSK